MPAFGCVGITARLLYGELATVDAPGVDVGEPRLGSWLADEIVDTDGGVNIGWSLDEPTTPGLSGVSLAFVVLKDVEGTSCVMGGDPVELSIAVVVIEPCSGATPPSSEGTVG